jgi:hypothetical protein
VRVTRYELGASNDIQTESLLYLTEQYDIYDDGFRTNINNISGTPIPTVVFDDTSRYYTIDYTAEVVGPAAGKAFVEDNPTCFAAINEDGSWVQVDTSAHYVPQGGNDFLKVTNGTHITNNPTGTVVTLGDTEILRYGGRGGDDYRCQITMNVTRGY